MTDSTTPVIDLTQLAQSFRMEAEALKRVVGLLDESLDASYLAHYRKDETDGLREEELLGISDRVREARQLEERRQSILRSLENHGHLNAELTEAIRQARDLHELEDLHLPYRTRKPTLAEHSGDEALGILAERVLAGEHPTEELARQAGELVCESAGRSSVDEVLSAVRRIVAQRLSQRPDLRKLLRAALRKNAMLISSAADSAAKPDRVFAEYTSFRHPLRKTTAHRMLTIRRGERKKVLDVRLEADRAPLEKAAAEKIIPPEHPQAEWLRECLGEAITELILPVLTRELLDDAGEKAAARALSVAAQTLRNALLAKPLQGQRILAIDSGARSGCPVAALDESGEVLGVDDLVLTGEGAIEQASAKLIQLIDTHRISLVVLANGPSSRQVLMLIHDLLEGPLSGRAIQYAVIHSAGATAYALSAWARDELRHHGLGHRSAIWIGRQVQDPMGELTKVEPANLVSGLFQEDLRSKRLRQSLGSVVRASVALRPVDLNRADASLLRFVPGLDEALARKIVAYRRQHGPLRRRSQLLEIPDFPAAAYEQAAGFLRVHDGDEPLDATPIHPSHYALAENVRQQLTPACSGSCPSNGPVHPIDAQADLPSLAAELGCGKRLLADIFRGLDPAADKTYPETPALRLRTAVVRPEALQVGERLEGTVLSVVDFGAFVDVGLPEMGLVHISQLADRYISDPHDVVFVGQQVAVWVASIDSASGRVSLTMVPPGTVKHAEQPPRRARPAEPAGPSAPRPQAPRRRQSDRAKPARRADSPQRKPQRPKAPPAPITQAMVDGREPMRTFGDLLQFHQRRQQDEQPPADAATMQQTLQTPADQDTDANDSPDNTTAE